MTTIWTVFGTNGANGDVWGILTTNETLFTKTLFEEMQRFFRKYVVIIKVCNQLILI